MIICISLSLLAYFLLAYSLPYLSRWMLPPELLRICLIFYSLAQREVWLLPTTYIRRKKQVGRQEIVPLTMASGVQNFLSRVGSESSKWRENQTFVGAT
jgi:hypothetical protein